MKLTPQRERQLDIIALLINLVFWPVVISLMLLRIYLYFKPYLH